MTSPVRNFEAALAAVHHRVPARVQDPVHPVRAPEEAARDESAVKIAFPLAGAHRRKHVEVHLVEDSGRLADPLDLARGLDPAHLLHHAGAVDDLRAGQRRLQDRPVRGAHHRLLETDTPARAAEVVEHRRGPFVQRLAVVVEDRDVVDPGVPARAIDREPVEHQHRPPGARPDDHHASRGIGEIQMPGEGSGVVEPREIGEVRARTQGCRGQSVPVHQRMQALDVRDVRRCVHGRLSSRCRVTDGMIRISTDGRTDDDIRFDAGRQRGAAGRCLVSPAGTSAGTVKGCSTCRTRPGAWSSGSGSTPPP